MFGVRKKSERRDKLTHIRLYVFEEDNRCIASTKMQVKESKTMIKYLHTKVSAEIIASISLGSYFDVHEIIGNAEWVDDKNLYYMYTDKLDIPEKDIPWKCGFKL